MGNASVEARVIRLTAEHFGVSIEDLNRSTRFVEDLDVDSLDIVELLMSLEDEFEISVSDDDIASLTTITRVVDFIDGYGGAGSTARVKPPPHSDEGGAAAG